MADEPPPAKKDGPAPVLPPANLPAMAAAAAPVPLGPGERPSLAPGPEAIPLNPSNRSAIPPAPSPAPLAGPSAPPQLPASEALALAAKTPAADPFQEQIKAILSSARTIAVVGASDKPGKASHRVFFYLLRAGFELYPVNPAIKELGGRPAYPDLGSVPARIDLVDIFRRPEQVLPVVEEAIAVGARAVWMQEGIVNEEAAARAAAAGLLVVMDRCVMKEHRKMLGPPAN